MATRPMIQRRWPRNAERYRQDTAAAARDARQLLREARTHVYSNPHLASVMIADTMTILADIERYMTEAKIGHDQETPA